MPVHAHRQLLHEWRSRYDAPVTGWDFSELDDEMTEEDPPWSFDHLARRHLPHAKRVIDMGTGGGEALLGLRDALPADVVATEGWAPNLPVAVAALAPCGIEVVPYDAETDPAMPFGHEQFDLVLCRHEAYVASEVHRILRAGGRFLTQQVDGSSFSEVHRLLGGGTSRYAHVTLADFGREAQEAGLVIEQAEEWSGEVRFATVASMVRYFAMVPWEVPEDFSVERYASVLLELHDSERDLAFTRREFVLLARR